MGGSKRNKTPGAEFQRFDSHCQFKSCFHKLKFSPPDEAPKAQVSPSHEHEERLRLPELAPEDRKRTFLEAKEAARRNAQRAADLDHPLSAPASRPTELGVTHVIESPRQGRQAAQEPLPFNKDEWLERQAQARRNRENIVSSRNASPQVSPNKVHNSYYEEGSAERVKAGKLQMKEEEEVKYIQMLELARKQTYIERKELQHKMQQQFSSDNPST